MSDFSKIQRSPIGSLLCWGWVPIRPLVPRSLFSLTIRRLFRSFSLFRHTPRRMVMRRPRPLDIGGSALSAFLGRRPCRGVALLRFPPIRFSWPDSSRFHRRRNNFLVCYGELEPCYLATYHHPNIRQSNFPPIQIHRTRLIRQTRYVVSIVCDLFIRRSAGMRFRRRIAHMSQS